jgi:hypothetical protein
VLSDSTKTLLQAIVHSLETPDQAGRDDQIESGNQCLYEMHQMTRPSHQAYTKASSDKWPSHVPDTAGMNRAMPHVKAMMSAIRRKDRGTAVDNGKAALAEMNGTGRPSRVSAASPGPRTETRESSRGHAKLTRAST